MKLTLENHTLREALGGFRKLELRKEKLPLLKHVHLEARDQTLMLTATNLVDTLTYQTRMATPASGRCLIPVETLLQAAQSAPARSTLQLTVDGPKGRLEVRQGDYATPLPFTCGPLEEYPKAYPVPETRFTLPPAAISRIRDAAPSASSDPNRHILQGVLLESTGVVATDGHQLYAANSIELPLPRAVIIPARKPLQLFDPAQAVSFGLPEKHPDSIHLFQQGQWTWAFRPVQGQYPNWRQVCPKTADYPVQIRLSPADVTFLLEVAAKLPCAKEKDAPVSLVVDRDKLYFTAGGKHDRVEQRLNPALLKADLNVHTSLNLHFLLNALRRGLFTFHLKDELSPIVFKDQHQQYVVMPLRTHQASQPVKAPASPTANPPTTEIKPTMKPTPPPPATPKPAEPAPETGSSRLNEQIQRVRTALKHASDEVGLLVQAGRDLQRDHQALARDYAALRRSLRPLQKLSA